MKRSALGMLPVYSLPLLLVACASTEAPRTVPEATRTVPVAPRAVPVTTPAPVQPAVAAPPPAANRINPSTPANSANSAASTNPASAAKTNTASNVGTGAIAGAATGCALAKLIGEKCADGAAIGAVLGAVLGWSISSEKVGNAQSANAQAQKAGLPVPTNELRLQDYTLTPSATVVQAGGAALQVVGDIRLYGKTVRKPEVTQSMLLFQGNGEATSDTPQIARLENVDGAGHYRAVGVYKIPRGMPPGPYQVQSDLLINGKRVAQRVARFQVSAPVRQN